MKTTTQLLVTLTMICAGAIPAAAAESGEAAVYENRADIPIEYRWNLGDIFESVEQWQEAAKKLESEIPDLLAFKGRLAESSDTLAACLELDSRLTQQLSDLYVYASQWQTTDTRDAGANALQGQARGLLAAMSQAQAFIPAEVSQISDETLAAFLQAPHLKPFAHILDNMTRLKPHTRSSEVEEVLAGSSMLQGAPVQIYQGMVSADIQWPEIIGADGEKKQVVPALYYSFMGSQNRRVRKDAALALFGTYDQFGHALARTYAASVNKDVWLAGTRNYASTLEMALNTTNVPRSVPDTLVKAVHNNLDAIHDYVALRRHVLGVDDFHIYDLYVSMMPEFESAYSFDQGWKLATQFWLETFGPEYAAVAERALAERWIDVYPNTGKQGGAYSWGTYNTHPYLFLNWGGTLEDVFTLVHEMGHSIHTYLAGENNPAHNADYALFVAEVASVASESLFFSWMMDRTEDPEERLAMLNLRMNAITGTFLRQIFFHEFEAGAHAAAEAGKPLTKDSLGTIWGDLWQQYYGPDAVLDDDFKSGWARIPHFYRTFYVWVYATSFAAGEAIAGRFAAGDETAVDDYLALLKLGGSVYPMEAVKRAGVDMNDPKVIETVMLRYREILAEMQKMMAKK